MRHHLPSKRRKRRFCWSTQRSQNGAARSKRLLLLALLLGGNTTLANEGSFVPDMAAVESPATHPLSSSLPPPWFVPQRDRTTPQASPEPIAQSLAEKVDFTALAPLQTPAPISSAPSTPSWFPSTTALPASHGAELLAPSIAQSHDPQAMQPLAPLQTTPIPPQLPMGQALSTAEMGFSPPPVLIHPTWDAVDGREAIYDDRYPVPVQQPLIEWGFPFYGDGMIPPGGLLFSPTNLTHSKLYVYGDYRLGVGVGRNAIDEFANVASRLNLDIDWQWTSTERFHAFIGPLNNAGQFSQVDFRNGDLQFEPVFNPNLVTGFFEGDLGYIFGGLNHTPAEFNLPVAAGLLPMFHQNGIWMDDAVAGVAMAQNAKHSRLLNWSNYDATVFAIFDQLNSPVFGRDNHAGQALGTAWFIEAYGGYIETGYAYVHDRLDLGRSYHNATIAFTRRYFDRIGNSVRVIVNAGQDLPEPERTADGGVVIVENNWITANSLTVVPYLNFYYGWGRPQSVARNALAGDILRNVGINFETDGLNGYPTLDATAINTYGGAVGINLLGAKADRQLVLEAAIVQAYGAASGRVARGDQYGLGARYQLPLSHCTLLRVDTMVGFRQNDDDLYGIRCEYRFKF